MIERLGLPAQRTPAEQSRNWLEKKRLGSISRSAAALRPREGDLIDSNGIVKIEGGETSRRILIERFGGRHASSMTIEVQWDASRGTTRPLVLASSQSYYDEEPDGVASTYDSEALAGNTLNPRDITTALRYARNVQAAEDLGAITITVPEDSRMLF